jgi:hypothetical protein
MFMTLMLDRFEVPVLHVRFEGNSYELELSELNLNMESSEDQIKRNVAAHYHRPATFFTRYTVVRHSNAIVLRPEAIYG